MEVELVVVDVAEVAETVVAAPPLPAVAVGMEAEAGQGAARNAKQNLARKRRHKSIVVVSGIAFSHGEHD